MFQAGTRREGGRLVTAGGRVLSVVGRAPRLEDFADPAEREVVLAALLLTRATKTAIARGPRDD